MDYKELESKWNGLRSSHDIAYTRIDSICIPELNIGKNDSRRLLILSVPSDIEIHFRGYKKENIIVYVDKESNSIILELLDSFYNTIFNDLILSLYNQIKDIKDSKESTRIFISTINRWSNFLSNSYSSSLSKEQVRGLYGELTILKLLIEDSECKDINVCLSSWVGPYGETKDFVFDNLNIEVKTKNIDKAKISISSEFQLEEEGGKVLELIVVSVDEFSDNIEPISKIVKDIRNIILDKGGNLLIFLEALNQLDISFSNISNYDNFLFEEISIVTYDCSKIVEDNQFPRIVKSNLPKSLSNIKYDINLSRLDGFIKK